MPTKPTVLLVQDERPTAEAIAQSLRSSGVRVIDTYNAEEAVVIVGMGGFAFDAVMIDLRSSVSRGPSRFELAEWLQRRQPRAMLFIVRGDLPHDEAQRRADANGDLIERPHDVASFSKWFAKVAKDQRGRNRFS